MDGKVRQVPKPSQPHKLMNVDPSVGSRTVKKLGLTLSWTVHKDRRWLASLWEQVIVLTVYVILSQLLSGHWLQVSLLTSASLESLVVHTWQHTGHTYNHASFFHLSWGCFLKANLPWKNLQFLLGPSQSFWVLHYKTREEVLQGFRIPTICHSRLFSGEHCFLWQSPSTLPGQIELPDYVNTDVFQKSWEFHLCLSL